MLLFNHSDATCQCVSIHIPGLSPDDSVVGPSSNNGKLSDTEGPFERDLLRVFAFRVLTNVINKHYRKHPLKNCNVHDIMSEKV